MIFSLNKEKLKQSYRKTYKSLVNIIPLVIWIVMLISIIDVLVPKDFFSKIFTRNPFVDPFIGSALWSIMTWNPITGYILWKWFLDNWVSLVAVTAFLVSWVTVWLVQLPIEAKLLGKKFAMYRNISAFFISVLVAIVTVYIYSKIH